jgi:hypothetical protein
MTPGGPDGAPRHLTDRAPRRVANRAPAPVDAARLGAARLGAARLGALPALLLALLLVLLLALPGARAAEPPPAWVIPGGQEPVLRALLTPSAAPLAGAFETVSIAAHEDHVAARYAARGGGDGFVLELWHPTAAAPGDERTERFALRFPQGRPGADVQAALAAQVRAHEGAFLWKPRTPRPPGADGSGDAERAPDPGGPPSGGAPSDAVGPPPEWHDAQRTAAARVIAFGLLALFALSLPLLGRAARDALVALSRAERLAVLGAAALGLVVRLAAPHRLVKVFFGYEEVDAALDLVRLPKYGSSVPALHHVALLAGPADYDTVLVLHSVLGALSVPLFALWLRRLAAPRGAVGVAAFALALLPLFVKDHNSESYLVPALFWLSAGLLLLLDAADGRRLAWPAAAVALGLAILARPLVHVFAPALVVVTLTGAGLPAGALRAGLRRAWPFALALAALLVPNALHVLAAARLQAAEGSLPGLAGGDGLRLLTLPGRLVTENVAFDPAFVPTAVPALALAAAVLARGRLRRNLLLLLGVAVAWWAASFVDLPAVSRPRLQAPGVLLVTLAAAVGAVLLIDRVRARGRRAAARSLAVALAAAAAASAAFTIPALWARGNADEEARAFAAAVAHLPPEPVVFVRLGPGDEPRWAVHRAGPERLLLEVQRGDTVLGIGEYLDADPADRPVYAWLGVRCHAASREGRAASPLPPGRAHPLCERLRSRPHTVVFEREVPNHPAADFPWYPEDRPTLPVALIRLAPAAGSPGAATPAPPAAGGRELP